MLFDIYFVVVCVITKIPPIYLVQILENNFYSLERNNKIRT